MGVDLLQTTGLDQAALSRLLHGLPDDPPAALDPYLDAATRCFARHGIERTTVQDVAAEMGFNRATIYRQVGTIENQIRLLAARDVRRFLASVPSRVAGLSGPELVVELAAIGVEDTTAHPVLAKILADEPRLVGNILEEHIGQVRDQVVPVVASLCRAGMDAGLLARMEPVVLASWIVRIVVTLVVLEPEVELRSYLRELLLPALSPTRQGGDGSGIM
jgi:AcrR family transcriptional regulator